MPWVRTYSIVLYGSDRVKMEAAIDAAFDEVRRLDACCRIICPAASGARSIANAAENR